MEEQMRFRLLSGSHVSVDKSVVRGQGESEESFERRRTKFYRAKDRPTPPDWQGDHGDIVEANEDLALLFNPKGLDVLTGQPLPPKFERMQDNEQDGLLHFHQLPNESAEQFRARVNSQFNGNPSEVQKAAEAGFNTAFTDTYESMSVEELKRFAEQEEVDLKGAKKKEEIIKVLRSFELTTR